jgi:hypothetical protein
LTFRGLNEWDYAEITPVKTNAFIIEVEYVEPGSANYMVIYELKLFGY